MARYQEAIDWIAMNDDTEWLKEHPDKPSVTACMVADLWGKTTAQVIADLIKVGKMKTEAKTDFNIPINDQTKIAVATEESWNKHLNEHRLAVTTALDQIGMREVLETCRDYARNKVQDMIQRQASRTNPTFKNWNGMRNRLTKLVDWTVGIY
jgi:hypothetical protein